jgi:hypothetical protein
LKIVFKRVFLLLVVSVALNYPWEVLQMPLYVNDGDFLDFAKHCVVPAWGDAVIVVIIYSIGWALTSNSAWAEKPTASSYAIMLGVGFLIAVGVEWIAVFELDRWNYTPRMPIIPGLNIGLSPVLQMLLLPPLIFKITARVLKKVGN